MWVPNFAQILRSPARCVQSIPFDWLFTFSMQSILHNCVVGMQLDIPRYTSLQNGSCWETIVTISLKDSSKLSGVGVAPNIHLSSELAARQVLIRLPVQTDPLLVPLNLDSIGSPRVQQLFPEQSDIHLFSADEETASLVKSLDVALFNRTGEIYAKHENETFENIFSNQGVNFDRSTRLFVTDLTAFEPPIPNLLSQLKALVLSKLERSHQTKFVVDQVCLHYHLI